MVLYLSKSTDVATTVNARSLFNNSDMSRCVTNRVAEVVRGHGGPSPKSLDSDENFKPEPMLFCRELRFVAIYAVFGDL